MRTDKGKKYLLLTEKDKIDKTKEATLSNFNIPKSLLKRLIFIIYSSSGDKKILLDK